jgi:hypothetical protein
MQLSTIANTQNKTLSSKDSAVSKKAITNVLDELFETAFDLLNRKLCQ